MHIFWRFVFGIVIFVVLYFLTAEIFLYSTTSSYSSHSEKTIYFYDTKDGIYSHTELIIRGEDFPKKYLKLFDLHSCRYIAISYGDIAFMRDKGGFEDINYKIALKSLFTNDKAAIKVACYRAIKIDETRSIPVDNIQIQRIVKSIVDDIEFQGKKAKIVKDLTQYPMYRYYYSKKTYNLFHTCNTWVGTILRSGDIFVSYWTPLAYYLERSLDKIGIKRSKKDIYE